MLSNRGFRPGFGSDLELSGCLRLHGNDCGIALQAVERRTKLFLDVFRVAQKSGPQPLNNLRRAQRVLFHEALGCGAQISRAVPPAAVQTAPGPQQLFNTSMAKALLHALRLVRGWQVTVEGAVMPVWISWIGLAIAAYLAYQGFLLSKAPTK